MDLPIQEKPKRKAPRVKRTQPDIKYDIVSDVLRHKADIDIGELITVAPSLRRKLVSECRPKRKPKQEQTSQQSQQTMALLEDEELNTTAVYSTVSIGDKNIKALVDSGAAKTCVSKALADALGLEIDSASDSIFTLGNGTKQTGLGLIYDVPIGIKDDMVIPCTIEVLPSCPTHLILGNNWLNRAKARIDFNTLTLKVKYKHQKAKLPIYYERKNVALPKMRSYQQTYQLPVSLTNNKLEQSDEEQSDDSYEDDIEETESEDEESSENDTEEEMTDDEKENQSLFVLEDGTKEEVIITNFKESHIIQATALGLTIPANSSMTLTLDKPEKENPHLIYHFETFHPKLNNASGYFDTCSTLIVNKRTVEIRFFNRTNEVVIVKPEEELGMLERYNLNTYLQLE